MKRKIIILLVLSVMAVSINLVGCDDKEDKLNQSMVITGDVKTDTEPMLKVISEETIYFEEPLVGYGYGILMDENNNTILAYQDINNLNNGTEYSKVLIEGDKARLEYLGSDSANEIKNNITFVMKSISDSRYLINNLGSYDSYEIDASLIENEESAYFLIDNIFIEYNLSEADEVKIVWNNLSNGENGSINIPYRNIDLSNMDIVNNKLFLGTQLKKQNESPDTLLVIDLKENKVEKVVDIGEFRIARPINEERVLLMSLNKNSNDSSVYDSALEIYNINNNNRKELIKYDNTYKEKGDEFRGIDDIRLFSDREKLYYFETNMDKFYIKVAAIDGMELEDSITIYEMNYDSKGRNPIPKVAVSKDEREMIVYTFDEGTNITSNFKKIKLNK